MEKSLDGLGDKDEGSAHSQANDEGDSRKDPENKPFSNEEDEEQKEKATSMKNQSPRKVQSSDTTPKVNSRRRTPRNCLSDNTATNTVNRNRLVRFGMSEVHDNEILNDETSDVESQVDLLTLAAQRSHGIYLDACGDQTEEISQAAAAPPPGDLLESTRANLREEKLRLVSPGKSKQDYQSSVATAEIQAPGKVKEDNESSIVTAEIQALADAQAKAHAKDIKNQAYIHTTAPYPPANANNTNHPQDNTQQRTYNNSDEIMHGAFQAAPGQGIVRTEEFCGVLRQPMADENPGTRSSWNAAPNLQGLEDFAGTRPGQSAQNSFSNAISAVRVDEDDLELHIRDEITNNAAQAEVVDLEKETANIVESNMKRFRKKYICYGTIVLVVLGAIIMALVFGIMKAYSRDSDTAYHIVSLPTLGAIRERGYLKCGLTTRLEAVEYNDSTYYEDGLAFKEAICTAVASAALGGYQNVTTYIVPEADRWMALKNGTVDVLLVGTPAATDSLYWNLDPMVSVTFSTPFYFDGVGTGGLPGYIGNCANGSDYFNYETCRDLKVCVVQGSEAWEVAQELLHPSQIITATSIDNVIAKFVAGCCNVISTDYSNERTNTAVYEKGYDGLYAVGQGLYKVQPFAVATLKANWTYDEENNYDDDANFDVQVSKESRIFSEFVNWVIYALIAAEERNITQATANRFPQTHAFGSEYLGMFRNALVGGNYGEIYERTRQSTVPRARMNMLNNGTTGLHRSQLYGDLSEFVAPPSENGALMTIINRGELRCGIPMPTNFTSFNPTTGEMEPIPMPPFALLPPLPGEGMDQFKLETAVGTANIDIAYCRALATSVLLGQQQSVEDATCSIQSHDFEQVPEDLMPNLKLVFLENEAHGYTKLATGEIDVIAGYRMELHDDVHEEATGQAFTFSQPYLYGPTLSKHVTEANRCLVTQEHDDQWSEFVQSIVASLFYAEENLITQATANHMPLVNRFGPMYKRMFRDAVFEVGNYGEVYERSVEPAYPREGGPNMLNINAGPQLASRPGLF